MVNRSIHDERYLGAIKRLRTARKDARLSQKDLAAKLGARQQFVSKYESGERRLDVIEFLDVANALGLTLEDAIGVATDGAALPPTHSY